jgi:hypothetical protein
VPIIFYTRAALAVGAWLGLPFCRGGDDGDAAAAAIAAAAAEADHYLRALPRMAPPGGAAASRRRGARRDARWPDDAPPAARCGCWECRGAAQVDGCGCPWAGAPGVDAPAIHAALGPCRSRAPARGPAGAPPCAHQSCCFDACAAPRASSGAPVTPPHTPGCGADSWCGPGGRSAPCQSGCCCRRSRAGARAASTCSSHGAGACAAARSPAARSPALAGAEAALAAAQAALAAERERAQHAAARASAAAAYHRGGQSGWGAWAAQLCDAEAGGDAESALADAPAADAADAARRLGRDVAALRATRAELQARESQLQAREAAAAGAVRETVAALLERLGAARGAAGGAAAAADAAAAPLVGSSGGKGAGSASVFAALGSSVRRSAEQPQVRLLRPQVDVRRHSAGAARPRGAWDAATHGSSDAEPGFLEAGEEGIGSEEEEVWHDEASEHAAAAEAAAAVERQAAALAQRRSGAAVAAPPAAAAAEASPRQRRRAAAVPRYSQLETSVSGQLSSAVAAVLRPYAAHSPDADPRGSADSGSGLPAAGAALTPPPAEARGSGAGRQRRVDTGAADAGEANSEGSSPCVIRASLTRLSACGGLPPRPRAPTPAGGPPRPAQRAGDCSAEADQQRAQGGSGGAPPQALPPFSGDGLKWWPPSPLVSLDASELSPLPAAPAPPE